MPEEVKLGKVVLIEGDPGLVGSKLIEIKGKIFPKGPQSGQWVVYEAPKAAHQKSFFSETLNTIDADVSMEEWSGEAKAVVLRGILDNKPFRDAMLIVASHVAPTNYFIVVDEEGLTGGKKDNWKPFRDICLKRGKVINMGVPLSELKPSEQADFVIEEAKKRGKTIGRLAAGTMIEIVTPDKAMLCSELDKLCFAIEEPELTVQHIRKWAFPISSEYPVWKLCNALDTGNVEAVIEASEDILKGGKPPELLLHMAMQQMRLHLIAADLYTYRRDVAEGLIKFSTKDYDKIIASLRSSRELPERMWDAEEAEDGKEDDESKKKKTSRPINSFQAQRAAEFVGSSLLKEVLKTKPVDLNLAIKKMAMERFLKVFEAIDQSRMTEGLDAQTAFMDAMKAVNWRK